MTKGEREGVFVGEEFLAQFEPSPMIECGCCGRTHEDLPRVDCRAFVTCSKCGDAYLNSGIRKHEEHCTGEPNGNIQEVQ